MMRTPTGRCAYGIVIVIAHVLIRLLLFILYTINFTGGRSVNLHSTLPYAFRLAPLTHHCVQISALWLHGSHRIERKWVPSHPGPTTGSTGITTCPLFQLLVVQPFYAMFQLCWDSLLRVSQICWSWSAAPLIYEDRTKGPRIYGGQDRREQWMLCAYSEPDNVTVCEMILTKVTEDYTRNEMANWKRCLHDR
jgi:hypothetical protein